MGAGGFAGGESGVIDEGEAAVAGAEDSAEDEVGGGLFGGRAGGDDLSGGCGGGLEVGVEFADLVIVAGDEVVLFSVAHPIEDAGEVIDFVGLEEGIELAVVGMDFLDALDFAGFAEFLEGEERDEVAEGLDRGGAHTAFGVYVLGEPDMGDAVDGGGADAVGVEAIEDGERELVVAGIALGDFVAEGGFGAAGGFFGFGFSAEGEVFDGPGDGTGGWSEVTGEGAFDAGHGLSTDLLDFERAEDSGLGIAMAVVTSVGEGFASILGGDPAEEAAFGDGGAEGADDAFFAGESVRDGACGLAFLDVAVTD